MPPVAGHALPGADQTNIITTTAPMTTSTRPAISMGRRVLSSFFSAIAVPQKGSMRQYHHKRYIFNVTFRIGEVGAGPSIHRRPRRTGHANGLAALDRRGLTRAQPIRLIDQFGKRGREAAHKQEYEQQTR